MIRGKSLNASNKDILLAKKLWLITDNVLKFSILRFEKKMKKISKSKSENFSNPARGERHFAPTLGGEGSYEQSKFQSL